MDALLYFSSDVWAYVAVTLAVLLLLLAGSLLLSSRLRETLRAMRSSAHQAARKPRRRVKRIRLLSSVIQLGVAFCLRQDTSCLSRERRFNLRFIVTLVLVFVFLITFYFSSLIKTELVVFKRPDTMSTYEEVLAQRPLVRPIWLRDLRNDVEFQSAPEDTVEGKIWSRAVSLGLESSRIPAKHDYALQMLTQIALRRAVVLVPDCVFSIVITSLCALNGFTDYRSEARLWIRRDPRATDQRVAMMTASQASDQTKRRLTILSRHILEHSHMTSVFRESEGFFKYMKTSKEYHTCIKNRIVYPEDHGTKPLSLHHWSLVFIWTLMLLLLFPVTCYLEVHVHHLSRVMHRKR